MGDLNSLIDDGCHESHEVNSDLFIIQNKGISIISQFHDLKPRHFSIIPTQILALTLILSEDRKTVFSIQATHILLQPSCTQFMDIKELPVISNTSFIVP